jgi:hypothetical protein
VGCHIPIVNNNDSIGDPWSGGIFVITTILHNFIGVSQPLGRESVINMT